MIRFTKVFLKSRGMEVKISIIIPIFNAQRHLEKCLWSILNQSFQNFEVICIDDGSNDNSFGILNEFQKKDDRFYIYKQNHQGASIARNLGIKKAKGEYIQFLDSDDYFEKDLLNNMYDYAKKYNADLVVCSSKKIDENNNIIESLSPTFPINKQITPFKKVFNKKDFKDDIFSLFSTVVWNKLIKKTLLIDNSIEFPPLKIYEDISFVHSLVICADKIVAFDEDLINYRCHTKSLSNNRNKNTIEAIKSCVYLKEFLKEKGYLPKYEKAYKKAFINHIRAELSYCNNDEYEQFLKDFKKLLPYDWQNYKSALQKNEITYEYLNHIIGNKKVMLWGASLFLEQLLDKKEKNPNILGIIDKNPTLKGKKFQDYLIYSPSDINKIKPNGVILTVYSNNETIYQSLKKEFKIKYPNIELLPNIFERGPNADRTN